MSVFNPGPAGWVLGGLLVAGGVRILLALRRRRRTRLVAARRAACGWHPSMGPRPQPEPVTELLPRVCDHLDATVLIPRQREATR